MRFQTPLVRERAQLSCQIVGHPTQSNYDEMLDGFLAASHSLCIIARGGREGGITQTIPHNAQIAVVRPPLIAGVREMPCRIGGQPSVKMRNHQSSCFTQPPFESWFFPLLLIARRRRSHEPLRLALVCLHRRPSKCGFVVNRPE